MLTNNPVPPKTRIFHGWFVVAGAFGVTLAATPLGMVPPDRTSNLLYPDIAGHAVSHQFFVRP